MTERDQLYTAICQNPEDITLRLAFADWLEENDRQQCPCCYGKGRHKTGYVKCDTKGIHDTRQEFECGACGGSGWIKDESSTDLGEFIRAQCEMEGKPSAPRLLHLHHRVNQLLDKRGDRWRSVKCQTCYGDGQIPYTDAAGDGDWKDCPTCGGTGDLLRHPPTNDASYIDPPRTVPFRNGFPDSVTCTLDELGSEKDETCHKCEGGGKELLRGFDDYGRPFVSKVMNSNCPACSGVSTVRRFVPSKWAEAVVTHTPVVAFRITDREPDLSNHPQRAFGWQRQSAFNRHWSHRAGEPAFRYAIPDYLFALLPEPETRDAEVKYYDTREAANNSLAKTIGALVRGYNKAGDRGARNTVGRPDHNPT